MHSPIYPDKPAPDDEDVPDADGWLPAKIIYSDGSRPPPAPDPAFSINARERPEWKESLVPLLKELRQAGKLPDRNAAYHAVSDWLTGKGLTMSRSAIYDGLKRHCADWWLLK